MAKVSKKKHIIKIANLLLTRKCNLKCEYCAIIRDPEVTDYPTIKKLNERELSAYDWVSVIERIRINNPDCFFIFYGGEPFIRSDFQAIVKYANDKNINYTIISNNTDGIQDRIEATLQYCGGKFKGFTSSVDPELFNPKADKTSDIYKKTLMGFTRLCEMKKNNIADDVVAEITITPTNIKYLHKTIANLSKNDIYSSITFIDRKKSPYYDFSNVCDWDAMVEQTPQVTKYLEAIMKDKSLKIHMRELIPTMIKNLPCEMKCDIFKDFHNITVDSDGAVRMCLRIRKPVYDYSNTIDYVIDRDGSICKSFLDSLKYYYNSYCKGCNWTCMLMSKKQTASIVNH